MRVLSHFLAFWGGKACSVSQLDPALLLDDHSKWRPFILEQTCRLFDLFYSQPFACFGTGFVPSPSSSLSILPRSQAVLEQVQADQALTAALQEVKAFWQQVSGELTVFCKGGAEVIGVHLNLVEVQSGLWYCACDADCVGFYFVCSPQFLGACLKHRVCENV